MSLVRPRPHLHLFQSCQRNRNLLAVGQRGSEFRDSPRVFEAVVATPCQDHAAHLVAPGRDRGSGQGVPRGQDT